MTLTHLVLLKFFAGASESSAVVQTDSTSTDYLNFGYTKTNSMNFQYTLTDQMNLKYTQTDRVSFVSQP